MLWKNMENLSVTQMATFKQIPCKTKVRVSEAHPIAIARDFSWRGHSLKVCNKEMNMAQCRASRAAANQCLVDLWRQFALLLSTPCVDLDALTFLLLSLTNQHEGSEIVNITIARGIAF